MRCFCVAALFMPLIAVSFAASARAQDVPSQTMRTKMLIHGNYCGPGNNGPGMKPVDALDAACMRHDACTPDFGLPACGCHRQLKRDVSLIAASPRQPQDIRILASLIAQGSDLMMCHDGLALGH